MPIEEDGEIGMEEGEIPAENGIKENQIKEESKNFKIVMTSEELKAQCNHMPVKGTLPYSQLKVHKRNHTHPFQHSVGKTFP